MKRMIDAYLNNTIDYLFYMALCKDGPEWKNELFDIIRANREGSIDNPANILTAIGTNRIRDVDEVRELSRMFAEEIEGKYLRCDWPYKNEDILMLGIHPHDNFIGGLSFIDDHILASSSEDGYINILDYENSELIASFQGHNGEPVNHIVYDRERDILISCGDDFRIKLWDCDTFDEIAVLEGHENYVSCLAIAGNRLLSASKDQTVGVWDLESYKLLHRFRGHSDWVYDLAVSPDKREAVSCSLDNRVLHWEIGTGREIQILNEGAKRLSIFANDEELYIQLKGTCKEKYRPIGSSVLWPREGLLITAGHQIAFWDTGTWQIKKLSRLMYHDVRQLQHAGGCLIAISKSILGMDMESGDEIFELIGHGKEDIYSLSASPDGNLLATGDELGRLGIRRIEELLKKEYALSHAGVLRSILPCSDGTVLTGASDLSAVLWNSETGDFSQRFADFQSDTIGSVYLHWIDRGADEAAVVTQHEMTVVNTRSRSIVRHFGFKYPLYNNHNLVRYGDGFLAVDPNSGIIYTDVKTGVQEIVEDRHCYSGDGCLSSDGKLFLACGTTGVSDSAFTEDMSEEEKDKIKQREPLHAPLVLFDPEKKKVIREFWYPVFFKKRKCDRDKAEEMERHYPLGCAWSPDGKYFSALFSCGELMVWETAKLRRVLRKKMTKDDCRLPHSWIDNTTIAIFKAEGTVLVRISVPDGKETSITVSDEKVQIYKFSDNRRYLAMDSPRAKFTVYDLHEELTLSKTSLPSESMSFVWEFNRLYIGTENGTLHSFTIADVSELVEPDDNFNQDDSLLQ